MVGAGAPLLLTFELLKTILRERFVVCMWEIENACNILLDNPEKKITVKPKHRCYEYLYIYIYIYIQGVPRVKVTTSGECSLC